MRNFLRSSLSHCNNLLTEKGEEHLEGCYNAFTWDPKNSVQWLIGWLVNWLEWLLWLVLSFLQLIQAWEIAEEPLTIPSHFSLYLLEQLCLLSVMNICIFMIERHNCHISDEWKSCLYYLVQSISIASWKDMRMFSDVDFLCFLPSMSQLPLVEKLCSFDSVSPL